MDTEHQRGTDGGRSGGMRVLVAGAGRAHAAAFLAAFLMHLALLRAVQQDWWALGADLAVLLTACRLLRPRLVPTALWFTLYPLFYTFVAPLMCWHPDFPEDMRVCREMATTFPLACSLWLVLVAVVLVRLVLGEGRTQGQRLRRAANYVVPALEGRPKPESEDRVLVRPAGPGTDPTASLVRPAAGALHGDEASLVHPFVEGVQPAAPRPRVEPGPGVPVLAGPAELPRAIPGGRDWTRPAVQAACLGALAVWLSGLVWWVRVERPRQAYLHAIEIGDTARVRLMVARGADPDATDGDATPALSLAAHAGDPETVRVLVRAGAHLDGGDRDGRTPLMEAAMANNPAAARVLLEAGAAPDARDTEGTTALMLAASSGSAAIGRMLVQHGADVNARRESHSDTPLLHAATSCPRLVPLLLAHGADPNARNAEGATPLMHAAYRGDRGAVKALLAAGADPNAREDDGSTALMAAVAGCSADAARTLLARGADPDLRRKDGATALEVAATLGAHDVADVIRRASGARR